MIGFRRDVPLIVHAVDSFETGPPDKFSQCLMLHCMLKEIELVIINVYVHPTALVADKKLFYETIETKSSQFGCPNIICCSDFNTISNLSLDTTPGYRKPHDKYLNWLIETTELVDAFRILNPLARRTTFFHSGHHSGARLDYILVAGFFLNKLINCTIPPKQLSDHNPVVLTIETDRNAIGPGYWKFPAPLLNNETFIKRLTAKIQSVVQRFKLVSDPNVLWGTVKLAIRTEVSSFLKEDGLQDKKKLEEFEAKLAQLYYRRDNAAMRSSRNRINREIV